MNEFIKNKVHNNVKTDEVHEIHKLEENEMDTADATQGVLEVSVLAQESGRGEHRHAEVNGHDDGLNSGAPWLRC